MSSSLSDTCSVSVAPRSRARRSLSGSRSIAITARAPARRAPDTTCRPTPPQPITATLSPGCTRAAFRTAPSPVTTLQPTSAACQRGSDAGRGMAEAAGTTQRSAKQDTLRKCLTGAPSGKDRRVVPSPSTPRPLWRPAGSHRFARPARHCSQVPHDGTKQKPTWSPGATCRTAAPTLSTTPAPSWPSTIGCRLEPRCPSARCRSEWHTPAAATRTSTSSSRGGASSSLLDADRRPDFPQDSRSDPHAILHVSRASRSGSTPRPGPEGGAMVPSSAISSTNGSIQSRRSADHAGGS